MTMVETRAEEYRSKAEMARHLADRADLSQQKEIHRRAAKWDEMARKADAIEQPVHRNVEAIAANAAIKEGRLKR